jgi:hypothetical protein
MALSSLIDDNAYGHLCARSRPEIKPNGEASQSSEASHALSALNSVVKSRDEHGLSNLCHRQRYLHLSFAFVSVASGDDDDLH